MHAAQIHAVVIGGKPAGAALVLATYFVTRRRHAVVRLLGNGDTVLLHNHADQPGPWRVLLAEDDILLANTVDDFLTGEGFTVALAADGEAALQTASEVEFDVLLTDLRMPRIDGVELIRRLRANRPDLPVVIMSGNAPSDLRESLMRGGEGPLVMVTKPMRLTQLLGALNDVLKQRFSV